jgi:hypothetical protein
MAEKWHSGINIHKLSVGGGFEGLLFAVGCSLIFLFGFPTLWYFVALSIAFGVLLGLVFRVINSRRNENIKPLSILSVHVSTKAPQDGEQNKKFIHVQATCTV